MSAELDLQLETVAALDAGLTLPAAWYGRDETVYQRELERIFARTWQYAARSEQVAKPGSFVASRVGHIPVVVVRHQDGSLRGFVNVCRHRGHVVAQGEGRRESLQCPYHAWTYGLDGCLRAAPRSDREPDFDFDDYSLLPVSVDSWGPFVFVNPDPAAEPLAATLGQVPEHLRRGGVELDNLVFHDRTDWTLDVNWKLGIENYLECYHCSVAHPSFSKLIDVDPDSYVLQAERFSASQFGRLRDVHDRDSLAYRADRGNEQAQFHFLWPNTTINIEPGPPSLSIDAWLPAGPRRIRGWTDRFFAPDVTAGEMASLLEFVTQVTEEDRALVESVQEGLDSGLVSHGRLLPESEQLIRHFQRLVYDELAAGD